LGGERKRGSKKGSEGFSRFARRKTLSREEKTWHRTSWNAPVASTPTRDVFPAFWRPTSESSISLLKKRLVCFRRERKRERRRRERKIVEHLKRRRCFDEGIRAFSRCLSLSFSLYLRSQSSIHWYHDMAFSCFSSLFARVGSEKRKESSRGWARMEEGTEKSLFLLRRKKMNFPSLALSTRKNCNAAEFPRLPRLAAAGSVVSTFT
jgi:hypothetical protein